MSNHRTKWVVLAYASFLIFSGITGYLVAGSLISLFTGCSIGVLLLLSTIALFMKKRSGLIAASLLTLLTTAIFAYRYSMTKGLFPSGLLAVLSGAMLIFLLLQLARWKRK